MKDAGRKGNKQNRLADSRSLYLLQHAGNPVNWFPWGDEAFSKAREEDKPVFLSIGYSTCHWCHVMARESFEDDDVAAMLNRDFVSIKVDREERPDVDQVYMNVCQALTGRGGWPLTVFMTPERRPFFAGTYFPKEARPGMPGFKDVCSTISEAWDHQRGRLEESGEKITSAIQPVAEGPGRGVGLSTLEACFRDLRRAHDSARGGFGPAPKFPIPHNCSFLLRWHARSGDPTALAMVEKTLRSMRHGGIFGHLGYGFHRYSVDERWLVPHFEKMLYDQALLILAYVEAWQVTGNDFYSRVVKETASYVLRDMTSPEGGFYSAEDADSEGEEGLFYVWKPGEVLEHLGEEEGGLFCRFYNITLEGNFEKGLSIPHITETVESFAATEAMPAETLRVRLEESRKRLFELREQRIRPLRDDKIVSGWNGLMIAALARSYQALRDPGVLHAARGSADFVLANMRGDGGRLYRRYREGDLAVPGFLEDYSFLVWGLIELYEADFEARYLEEALALTDAMIDLFLDRSAGGFHFSGRDAEQQISRSKDIYDGATPSGNSVAIMNLLRLERMTGRADLRKTAEKAIKAFSSRVESNPTGFTHFLSACGFSLGPSHEIIVAGDYEDQDAVEMLRTLQQAFIPNKVLLFRGKAGGPRDIDEISGFAGEMGPIPDQAKVYWCEDFTCREPITSVEELREAISDGTARGCLHP